MTYALRHGYCQFYFVTVSYHLITSRCYLVIHSNSAVNITSTIQLIYVFFLILHTMNSQPGFSSLIDKTGN